MNDTFRGRPSTSLVLVFILLGLAPIAMILGAIPPQPFFSPKITMVSVCFFLTALVFAYRRYAHATSFSKNLIWVHPLFWAFLWLLIFYAVPSLYGVANPEFLRELFAWTEFSQVYTAFGMTLVAMGCVVMWASFDFTARIIRPNAFLRSLGSLFPSEFALLSAYAVLAILQIILYATTGNAYSRDTSSWGPLAVLFQPIAVVAGANILVIAFMAIGAFDRGYSKVIFLMMLLSQVTLEVASGFKKPVMWIALVVLIAALYSRVNLRHLILPLLCLMVVAVFVVPLTEEYRNALNQGGGTLGSLAIAFENSWGQGISHGLQAFLESVLGRQIVVAQMPGVVIERTPDLVSFRGWEQFFLVPVLLVPRVLWPSKPVVTQGVTFSHEYLGYPSFVESSSAPTVFGEGYMFAGWAGAVAVCLVIGVIAALIYRLVFEAGMVALGIALIPNLIDVESHFTSLFVGLTYQIVVYVLLTMTLLFISSLTYTSKGRAMATRFRRHARTLARSGAVNGPD